LLRIQLINVMINQLISFHGDQLNAWNFQQNDSLCFGDFMIAVLVRTRGSLL
jgi:uncharacterized protein YegJ (DUF2314 family)